MANKLLFVVNDSAFFLSHRLPIAIAARDAGYDVHVATAPGVVSAEITAHGFIHHAVSLSRGGNNPFVDSWTLFVLLRLFKKIRPSLVHLVTIKPVLYGGLAARATGVPAVVYAISGLGYAFAGRSSFKSLFVRTFALTLYKAVFRHPNLYAVFQNLDDRERLLSATALSISQTKLIRGSGVDLTKNRMKPERVGVPVVIMACRLIRDKGVYEFVQAARILKDRGVACEFWLVGDPDPDNPASVTANEVTAWQSEGAVVCLGYRSDVAELYADSHVVTLPSYYGEGLPKTLLEAAACGRAVVTTDMPGCREAIEPDVSGLLVPPKDSDALADALMRLIGDPKLRERMGQAGRALAEAEFGIDKVVRAHLGIYAELVCKS